MAAKVAMVAVPTVLGIASIRVYTESPGPSDGLVTREKLNVYTPFPHGAPVHSVPDRPGVIEGGVTTARESLLPAAQAVKEAFVSVKKGGLGLYHTGQDVCYYLRDPPPGFLPRFGTITMAGLLGMFLARKGSRFKRLAVPLGLMSAGASVCYPAPAVAVIKMTSRKVYAAGQWSSAAVSSLLTSPPQEAAKETRTSQPQSADRPDPAGAAAEASADSSVQTAPAPGPEGEGAEPTPVDVEVPAATTEETTSPSGPEVSPEPAPTESDTVETEAPPPSESSSVPAEDVESFDKTLGTPEKVSGEGRPAESTVSSEPETVEVAQVQTAEDESSGPSEETQSPEPVDRPAEPVDELPQSEPTVPPDVAEQLPDVDESAPLTSPVSPALELPPATSEGGSHFKPDPSLLDFGQSSAEDEDLYTTRG